MLDLPAILKQAEAATEGPWTPSFDGTVLWSDSGALVLSAPSMGGLRREQRRANIEFIAACRSDVPRLATALQEAQAEIVRLKGLAAYYPAWLPQGESE